MNLNLILFVLVLFLAGGTVLHDRRLRSCDGVVLAVLGVGFFAFPSSVGYVGAPVWLALIGIPRWWSSRLATALIFGDYGGAARAARWVALFHPDRWWRARARLHQGIVAVSSGDREGGEEILSTLRGRCPEFGPLIELELAALKGDYRGVLASAAPALRSGVPEVGPLVRHLEALGELGDLEGLERAFMGLERGLRGAGRSMARLILGAFHGEAEFVRQLLTGPCAAMPPELKQYWLATAYQARGERSRAQEILSALVTNVAPDISGRVARRLSQPIPAARPIPPQLARSVGSAIHDEARFGDVDRIAGPVTRVLLFLILGVFIVEVLLGATMSALSLFRLGAFSVGAVLADGEWWRCVTALFLHAGFAHVTFNALALYSLAPFVERSLGSVRFLIVYFGSGVGGLTVIAWATALFGFDDRLVVGASGAIMGLVGATGAILAHAARSEGSPVARERLRTVGTIIGLQIVFDILVPQTSATAHLIGAALGFAIGWVVHDRGHR